MGKIHAADSRARPNTLETQAAFGLVLFMLSSDYVSGQ